MPIEDFTFYNGKVKICSFLSYSTDGKIEEIVEKLKKSESWEKLHRKMGLTASEEDTQFSHWLVTGDKKINSKLINGDKTIQALEQAAKKCL